MDRRRAAEVFAALGDETRLEIVETLWNQDLGPGEIAGRLGVGSNLVAHHLDVLERAGVVERRESSGDRRRRYVVLRRQALGRLIDVAGPRASSILFVCTHNSARSKFAEALASRSGLSVQSAGTRPSEVVHPLALVVAEKHNVELTGSPKPIEAVEGRPDVVISVCDRAVEAGLGFDAPRMHWSVRDPVVGGRIEDFEGAFEEVSGRVSALLETMEGRRP